MEEKERNWSFPSSASKGTVKFSNSDKTNDQASLTSKRSTRPSFATQDSQRTLIGSENNNGSKPRGPRRRESGGKVGSLIKRYDSISSLSSVQRSPPDRKTSLASVDSNSISSPPSSTTNSNWTPASRFSTSPPPTPMPATAPAHDTDASFASPFQPPFPSTPPTTNNHARQLPTPPETPSLLQAYDRIARSQQEARLERMNSYQARRVEERETKGEWEQFWEEVKRKSSGGAIGGEEGPNGGR
ncbi:hypothetical protein BDY24DRAFT_387289 [Mrakia frigida]|uniref:uncharacterized protein n=1 Tax=Mrakia frigida TaxID=29902 RepID=UPI003FCBF10B